MIPSNWSEILQTIRTPLIHFGLTILVIGAITIASLFSDIGSGDKFISLCVGYSLVFIVFITVALVTVIDPEKLIFPWRAHIRRRKLLQGEQGREKKEVSSRGMRTHESPNVRKGQERQ